MVSVSQRTFARRTLILGTSALACTLLEEIAARAASPYHVVGIVADGADGSDSGSFPFRELIVGSLDELGTLIDRLQPDRIVVAMSDRRGRLPMHDLLEARVRGVDVEDGVECYERLTGKIAIEALPPSALIASSHFRKSHVDLAFGHALSLIVAALSMVLLLPLFALIAIAIKLDSSGPVFFVQERAGAGGRRFRLRKFRTMRPVERCASEWARDNTDRITRVGRWLRKYRLDELPQLINVLRGEMNLVGPRPHPMSNVRLFSEKIPYYSLRTVVRPGLTGWAQVRQGYANGLEEETEKMRYDLYYIKHMSAWLDVRILFGTVQIILSGHESATAETDTATGRAPEGPSPAAGLVRSPALVRSMTTSAPQ
jgi:exopolysaccharide biosynthesis polyprenyl glycosylphosphotransferase